MNRKALLLYTLFFCGLIGCFYFALTRFIPGYGEVKLPVISYVRPFSFINQEGRTITERDIAGKVYVAEYFFTTCGSICPKMNTNMKKVYKEFKDEKDFLILSHTVDPDIDSVGKMKRYADSLGADPKRWFFLTGRKDSLYRAARVSYLLDDPRNGRSTIDDQFIHTQLFALIDKKGQVRKIYDGLKENELQELSADIKKLLNEKSSGNFANSIFSNNPG